MKKADLEKLADALNLAGYEIVALAPAVEEHTYSGVTERYRKEDALALEIKPKA